MNYLARKRAGQKAHRTVLRKGAAAGSTATRTAAKADVCDILALLNAAIERYGIAGTRQKLEEIVERGSTQS